MPWTKPLNGNARVTAAGKVISGRREPSPDLDMDTALSVAGNWRSSHGYPLHVFKLLLRRRAKDVDAGALVAQRLKRLPSIISKLKRFNSMQLATMQDLGGCRAVVRRVFNVHRLVRIYEEHPTAAAKLIGKKDYIADPKPDGYRGVHLIYEYQGASQGGVFCGQKVEIQFRSRFQHAWATALETIDTFTDQALKSGFGSDAWKRFFALMATAIALDEKQSVVPGTPANIQDLKKELKPLCRQLRVPDVFQAFSAGIKMATGPAVVGAVAWIAVRQGWGHDVNAVNIRVQVNGEVRQNANTSTLLFPVQEMVAAASRIMHLVPGDVISTGSPAGTGMESGVYLARGDVVDVEIDGIGSIRNVVGDPR